EPDADLVTADDGRLGVARDLDGVVDVVEMAVRDEHQVALVDRLQILGRGRVVHDPRGDEDLFALCAPRLPGAVTDPRERDRVVQRHQRDSCIGTKRSRRTASRLATHTATTPAVPISARTRRTTMLE